MKTFKGFVAEVSDPDEVGTVHQELSNLFAFCFKEDVFQKMALTFTCFKYGVDIKVPGNSRYHNINRVLYSYVFLINTIKYILKTSGLSKEELEKNRADGLSGATEFGYGEDIQDLDPDDDDGEEEDQYSRINRIRNQNRNQNENEMNIDDDDEVLDDDDEEIEGQEKETTTASDTRSQSETPRNYMPGIVPVDNSQRIRETKDSIDEFVYITRVDGYVVFVLPLMNSKLSTREIKSFITELYAKAKRTDGIDPKEFTHKLKRSDFSEAYRQLRIEAGYANNVNSSHINDPTDIFNAAEFFDYIKHIDGSNFLKNMFFAEDYDVEDEDDDFFEPVNKMHSFGRNPEAFRKGLKFTTPSIILNYEFKIHINQFDYESLTQKLLPWLDVDIANFFLDYCNADDDDTNPFIKSISEKLFSKSYIAPRLDTLDSLRKYVDDMKDSNKNGELTEDDKMKAIKIFPYIIENRKIMSKMSVYNRAISNEVLEKRRKHNGNLLLAGPKGFNKASMQRINKKINERLNEKHREVDASSKVKPFSKFLLAATDLMKSFNTLPEEYKSIVVITPFLIADSQNRQDGHRYNFFLIGPKESSKNYITDRIVELICEGSSHELLGFSDRAFVTENSHDGGMFIFHEPPAFFTIDQKKLGRSDREMLNNWKQVTSCSEWAYMYFDYVETSEGGKRRVTKNVRVPVRMVLAGSANDCTNKEQAFMSRFHIIPITKSLGHQTIKNITKNKTIEKRERDGITRIYREIVNLTQMMQMLISCGIIQKPEISIADQIICDILVDLKYSGIKDSSSARNFSRLRTVFHHLILARAIVEEFYVTDDDEIRHSEYDPPEFEYEDLVRIGENLHITTEDLIIGTNFLWRQYVDPIKSDIVNTFLKTYTEYSLENIQIDSKDIENGKDLFSRLYGNGTSPTDDTSNFLFGKSRRTIDCDDDDDDDDDDIEFDTSSIKINGLNNPNTPQDQNKNRTDGTVTFTNNRTKSNTSFIIAIKRLDKMLCEYFTNKSEYVRMCKVEPQSGYNFGKSEAMYNLNYLVREIQRQTTKKDIAKKILFSMTKEPIMDSVEATIDDLENPKHDIPIYFNKVPEKVMNTIFKMYRPNRRDTNYARFKFLVELFTNDEDKKKEHTVGHKEFKKTYLLKYIKGRKNDPTRIEFSPFMFAAASPESINLSIKNMIETVHTETSYVFSPKITQNTKESDMGFVKIQRNPRKDAIIIDNPAYVNETTCELNMEMNLGVKNAGKNKRDIINIDDDDDDEEGENLMERFLLSSTRQKEEYLAKMEIRKHKTLEIKSSFDDYVRTYKSQKSKLSM